MKPNLFKYATSELSQDAFICWLLDWANDSNYQHDEHLNLLAQTFVDILVDKKLLNYHIEIDRQLNNIDVYAIINDTYFVVIEDKKGTSEHSNQLEKYAEFVRKNEDWKHLTPKLVYFKMEEQSNFLVIETAKYVHFDRSKMMKILNTYFNSVPSTSQNHILQDFHKELLRLDSEIESFKTLPAHEWTYYSWMGFFHHLQNKFTEFEPSWTYVSNASGGFLGFFWNWIQPNQTTPMFYLQIEQTGLLTFRSKSDDIELNKKCRPIFIGNLLNEASKNNLNLVSYGGKGKSGKSMGVLKLGENFIKTDANGVIDLLETIQFLQKITSTMTNAVSKID